MVLEPIAPLVPAFTALDSKYALFGCLFKDFKKAAERLAVHAVGLVVTLEEHAKSHGAADSVTALVGEYMQVAFYSERQDAAYTHIKRNKEKKRQKHGARGTQR